VKTHTAVVLAIGVGLITFVSPAMAAILVPTPEPSTSLLIGGGLGALFLFARRKRSNK